MSNYYNENDPKAARWLIELMEQGAIPRGEVDERSIEDVSVTDLAGFTQHHFFAGIGGWSLALSLAGWPAGRSVWTGSCPCQPFSAAGKRAGVTDDRHLWPAWNWLIKQYRPDCIFGEQVASKDGIAWLDIVSTDLENQGYAFGPIVLPACSVGAFHKRERSWFVADTNGGNASAQREQRSGQYGFISKNGPTRKLDDSDYRRSAIEKSGESSSESSFPVANADRARSLSCPLPGLHREEKSVGSRDVESQRSRSTDNGATDTESDGWIERWSEPNWRGAEWYRCKDGKYRAIESGIQPLAHGVSGRVGLLRGYGNAIVPQVAAEVIKAYRELRGV